MKLTKDERMLAVLYGDGTRCGLINALEKMRMVLQEDEKAYASEACVLENMK